MDAPAPRRAKVTGAVEPNPATNLRSYAYFIPILARSERADRSKEQRGFRSLHVRSAAPVSYCKHTPSDLPDRHTFVANTIVRDSSINIPKISDLALFNHYLVIDRQFPGGFANGIA
jgi:hypothetical protein